MNYLTIVIIILLLPMVLILLALMRSHRHFPNRRQFERLDAQLSVLDSNLEQFAKEHNLKLTRNSKEWPERSLRWSASGMDLVIQIYLTDSDLETFDIWTCASLDRNGKRLWKRLDIKNDLAIAIIKEDFEVTLNTAFNQLNAIKSSDLIDSSPFPKGFDPTEGTKGV